MKIGQNGTLPRPTRPPSPTSTTVLGENKPIIGRASASFLVSAAEALPIIGLFSPSTVVLVGLGGLVGLGRVPFWPVFIATILGAAIGDAISYWAGRIYKELRRDVALFSLSWTLDGRTTTLWCHGSIFGTTPACLG